MGYRYQLIRIESSIYKDEKIPATWWCKEGRYTNRVEVENPEWLALKNGTYLPPQGSRIIAMHRCSFSIDLLLEFENADGHPYKESGK